MTVTAADSFYLFKTDGLEGPYSPVQLRLMLDAGQIDRGDYCQPESGGPTRVLREIFDDPEAFLAMKRPGSRSDSGTDLGLDPFASGDVPLMGDTLPIQAGSRDYGSYALYDSPPTSAIYRAAYHPPQNERDVALDATVVDRPAGESAAAVLYHGHPSYLNWGRSLTLAMVAVVAGYLLLPFGAVATVSCAGFALLVLTAVWADRSFADFVVTTRRVEVITGIISRSSNEVKIDDIRSINVVKKGLLGFLGIGSVEFASSGGDDIEVCFKNITGAHRVKEIVRKIQDA